MNTLFLIVWGFFCFRFIQLLMKMNQQVILPTDIDELTLTEIRADPNRMIEAPTYANHKLEITIHLAILLLSLVTLVVFDGLRWSFYLLWTLILLRVHDVYRLFAIREDGLLLGSRFLAWSQIQSVQFELIDRHHSFYGYSAEVNNGYELKVKGRWFWFSKRIIITTEQTKQKIHDILRQHAAVIKNPDHSN